MSKPKIIAVSWEPLGGDTELGCIKALGPSRPPWPWMSSLEHTATRVDRGIEYAMRHNQNLLRRLAE